MSHAATTPSGAAGAAEPGRADPEAWLRRLRAAPGPTAGAPLLVCFPHAGGAASSFRPLAAALGGAVETVAVQYPGRQDRYAEPCVEDLDEMAALVAESLRLRDGGQGRPTAFFGHSMGATLAFAVARLLEGPGSSGPVGLFASARKAPSVAEGRQVHLLGDAEVVAELKSLGGTAAGALDDEELVGLVLPAVRSDYRALETYRPRPGERLGCPVTAVLGDADPRVAPAQAAAWAGHTASEFRIRVLPGGHFYLNDQVEAVAGLVRERLAAWAG
ncbi:alpha/beta fold hydrolase [Streptomyces sp. NPDC047002]|uniref:thioesterase II family protein n=1 Tax=Streptomyces sp. NPDC047002 TaxID=3155475 RepID=UPI003456444F